MIEGNVELCTESFGESTDAPILLTSRASRKLGLEDLPRGAAGAEAGWDRGECRDHEDRGGHDGEQLPERRRDRVRTAGGDEERDASRDAEGGPGERGKHLRRREPCTHLLRCRAKRTRH